MNYVHDPLPPLCVNCARRVEEEAEDTSGQRCNDCHFKAEAEELAEKVEAFRWTSRDWLKCHHCSGTGEHGENYCFCHVGQAAHDAEAARFASVKGLPALAVCSADELARIRSAS